MILEARASDVEAMLDLSADRREVYRHYHPLFHRPAQEARERQRPYFEGLISNPEFIVRIARRDNGIIGFAVGHLVSSPPVYDPGGLTCVVDDFVVGNPALWASVGSELLADIRNTARLRGAVQVIAVVAPEDRVKRELLLNSGLRVVSEWVAGAV